MTLASLARAVSSAALAAVALPTVFSVAASAAARHTYNHNLVLSQSTRQWHRHNIPDGVDDSGDLLSSGDNNAGDHVSGQCSGGDDDAGLGEGEKDSFTANYGIKAALRQLFVEEALATSDLLGEGADNSGLDKQLHSAGEADICSLKALH